MPCNGVGIDPAYQLRDGEMLLKGNDTHGDVSFHAGLSTASERAVPIYKS